MISNSNKYNLVMENKVTLLDNISIYCRCYHIFENMRNIYKYSDDIIKNRNSEIISYQFQLSNEDGHIIFCWKFGDNKSECYYQCYYYNLSIKNKLIVKELINWIYSDDFFNYLQRLCKLNIYL